VVCGLLVCLCIFFAKGKKEVRRTREEKAKRESRRGEVERGREEVSPKGCRFAALSRQGALSMGGVAPPHLVLLPTTDSNFYSCLKETSIQGLSRATGEQQRATARAETGAKFRGSILGSAASSRPTNTAEGEKTSSPASHKTFALAQDFRQALSK
jgi:hypothetical protein